MGQFFPSSEAYICKTAVIRSFIPLLQSLEMESQQCRLLKPRKNLLHLLKDLQRILYVLHVEAEKNKI